MAALVAGCGVMAETVDTTPRVRGDIAISGLDDPLELIATISTREMWRRGLVPVQRSDIYLRGIFAKDGSQRSAQIYTNNFSDDWRRYSQVRFLVGDSLVVLPLTEVGSDVSCSQYGCRHQEDAVATVDMDLLDIMGGATENITVRITSGAYSGYHHEAELTSTELQVFRDSVSSVSARLGFAAN
ncbi:MAG: hypothetical protein AAGJ10_13855 [Bacteroidota bacterium]